MRAVLIAPIRVYQRAVSPLLPRRCKYHPTCSAYAVGAIREFGALLRCTPWSHGGVDYPTDQRVFRR